MEAEVGKIFIGLTMLVLAACSSKLEMVDFILNEPNCQKVASDENYLYFQDELALNACEMAKFDKEVYGTPYPNTSFRYE
jgi:hypothetical protein